MQYSLKALFGVTVLAAVALACLRASPERFTVCGAIGALLILQAMADPSWDWRDLPLSFVVWLALSTAFFLIHSAIALVF